MREKEGHQREKSFEVSIVLVFFLGALGAHNFYIGKKLKGSGQFLLLVFSLILTDINPYAAIIVMIILTGSVLADAKTILSRSRKYND